MGSFYLILIGAIQIICAYPFLVEYSEEYMATTFKFDRKFSINSSINFNWILYSPLFHSTYFTTPLLLGHVGLLVYFLFKKWLPLCHPDNKFRFKHIFRSLGVWPIRICDTKTEDAYHIAEVFFTCNFIGLACARSIHQQFLVWYWFSIPFILYEPIKQGRMSLKHVTISIILLNYCYSFSSTPPTSLIVFIIHVWYMVNMTLCKRTGVQQSSQTKIQPTSKFGRILLRDDRAISF